MTRKSELMLQPNFSYWWLNFNYISCENPIYIYMNFDRVALALYPAVWGVAP